jgi:predicted anti-sigma-YlaC factor YlaD
VDNPGPPHAGDPSGYVTAPEEVTCQQFVELVTDYFEGALATRTLNRVEEHLVLCDWCATYAQQMGQTTATLHELKDELSAHPSEAVLRALRARKGS